VKLRDKDADSEMNSSMDHLREIVARLRAPGGCPWDQEQTPRSLCHSLIEEAYEVVDAIEHGQSGDLEEELGDLLINLLMQAEMASEQQSFTIDTIAAKAAEKLMRRHPHVFGDSKAETSDAVLTQWEEIKRSERKLKGFDPDGKESLLAGVAKAFPALVRAQKIQKKAAKAGFDWEHPKDVLEKVREEIHEVEVEMNGRNVGERLAEEVGDLLFAVVNLSRVLSIDAESCLHAATEKFCRRFETMERQHFNNTSDMEFSKLSFAEMNALWERAKAFEKAP